ncbi:apolipoprotein N-acyltransferase [Psychromarinibacter halotolerans]|uniref:Apolipoprotein N-acyltransferase n=2 Tax=Psychromarinibacter halotolerans TaxID=1775175 RepID=A0ABV7GN92_9RHOB|nr:apolipoprotein N-acyltransferase [Psychromarinibacter halotolerans]MDF0596682.1 apolipoprotein N-acyltransferase [Psychromarinibacter halotolerans]
MPAAILLGALAALGQAPVGLPWATLAALALVFRFFVLTSTVRGAAWIGWSFGAGYFAASLFWIVEPFFVDIARHGWMAPFALVFMAGGFALFWGAAFALAHWIGRGTGRWGQAVAFALALAFVELTRSYILTGFPWAMIGHVWVGWGPMQLVAWVGPVGLSVLTVLAAALASAAWPSWRRGGLALLPFAVLYGLGMWQAAQPVPAVESPQVVRLVQPNAAQHLKWDPDHATTFFRRQLEYTAAGADGRPDLVIWPETAIPTVLNNAEPLLMRVAQAAGGVPVVLGIQRWEGRDAFNSLIVLDGDGVVADLYDKYHLVPFGEYLPLSSMFDTVGMTLFGSSMGFGYSSGPGPQLLDLGPLGSALPLICYEAIFPQDVNAAPARPGWLLQITNDAWFGKVSGPYQHLAQARLRAVEQGLPMVRAANTGVSAVIDARGEIVASIPLNEAGWIDSSLPSPLPPTIYANTGDWPVFFVLLAGLSGLIVLRRRNAIDASSPQR